MKVTANSDGSVTAITKDPTGNISTQHTIYNSDGTINTNVNIKNGQTTTTIHNADKSVTTINPDNTVSVSDPIHNTVAKYDSDGNLTSFKNPTGHITDSNSIANDTAAAEAVGTKDTSTLGKVKDWMSKNPGTTIATAMATLLGVAGMAYAYQQYQANNNKTLTIVSSSAGTNSGDVNITYSPNTTIVADDKITLGTTNFTLSDGSSPTGQQFSVIGIISDTQITINIPNIQNYATSGTFTLQTTMSNQIWGGLANLLGVQTACSYTGLGSTIICPILNLIKPYMTYLEIFCGVICCLILTMIFYKIFHMFGGSHQDD